tara:strand:+ start:116 stop:406 length:291 start_codon:yes stop_codon:yes gene_type:complete
MLNRQKIIHEIKKFTKKIISYYKASKIDHEVFHNGKRLKKNNNYYSIDPLPAENELTNYYINNYKKNSNFRKKLIDERAILHFNLIQKKKLLLKIF